MQIKIKNYLDPKKNFKSLKDKKKLLKKLFKKNLKFKSFFETFNSNYNYSLKHINFKNISKFQNIIVIGMGGSILGSKAIYSMFFNKVKKNFYFLDNLKNYESFSWIKKKDNLKQNFFIIISKSGNTLETLINFSILKNYINKNNSIIMAESTNNELKKISLDLKIPFVTHKYYIGGRYSVLSEVGMLPAKIMGLNIKNFKKNINFVRTRIEISKKNKFINCLSGI